MLIGTHGSGIGNLLFLSETSPAHASSVRPGVLEIFPYQFKRPTFARLAAALSVPYREWHNARRDRTVFDPSQIEVQHDAIGCPLLILFALLLAGTLAAGTKENHARPDQYALVLAGESLLGEPGHDRRRRRNSRIGPRTRPMVCIYLDFGAPVAHRFCQKKAGRTLVLDQNAETCTFFFDVTPKETMLVKRAQDSALCAGAVLLRRRPDPLTLTAMRAVRPFSRA